MTDPADTDRTVHAIHPDGAAIVRYDRAGKWFLEELFGRRHRLQIPTAVDAAVRWVRHEGGTIRYGLPGGTVFDARCRKALSQQPVWPPKDRS